MSASIRDRILGAAMAERPLVTLNPPGWGGPVYVRPWSSMERDGWESAWLAFRKTVNRDEDDSTGFHAHLLRYSLCDETGRLLFTDGDIDALGMMAASKLVPVARAVCKIQGIHSDVVEELEKNSDGSPSDAPG